MKNHRRHPPAPAHAQRRHEPLPWHRPKSREAESVLQCHGIEHTIVVFGSTRIPEPAAAERGLRAARQACAAAPIATGDPR